MNTNELLQRWSSMSLTEIEDQIISGEDLDSVTQLIGADTVAEIRAVSFSPTPLKERENVILLPGIMGSLLSSISGVTSSLWINPLLFLKGNGSYLRLNETGDEDENPQIECVPVGLEKLTYLKISLRFKNQTNLFEFPYDWRRPIEHSADRLRQHIDRWCQDNPNQTFTLVAHSMGGLVSRTYLARHPAHAKKHIKRLIMHGTPNYGATNAIDNLVNGNSMMATVDQLNSRNNMKSLVPNLPSLYQLLPTPPEFFPKGREYPISFNLYDARNWQMESIRQNFLDKAYNLHQVLTSSDPQIPINVIAGVHIETMVSARFAFEGDVPHLEMRSEDRGENSGDGTVPLWSADLPGAKTFYVQEVHRALPGNRKIIQASIDLIQNGACDLPETLPPPKLISFEPQENLPSEIQAEVLQNKIEAGTANEADLQNLYFAF